MSPLKSLILAGALALAASAAAAQPGGPPAPAPPAATPPGPTTKPPGWETQHGMGPYHMGPNHMGPNHMGPNHMAQGHGAPAGRMGWSLMTPEERKAHHAKMAAMKTQGECHAYMQQHHQMLVDRAKQRGAAIPQTPMHDPCARLPK